MARDSGRNHGRRTRKQSGKKSKYATGSKAYFICDRSGFKYPYHDGVVEPGTGLRVHWSESDGMYNLVDHPQNRTPRVSESIQLRNPRLDRDDAALAGSFYLGTEDGLLLTTEIDGPLETGI